MRLPAVRAAGGGPCMMLAAARGDGMQPGGADIAPANSIITHEEVKYTRIVNWNIEMKILGAKSLRL